MLLLCQRVRIIIPAIISAVSRRHTKERRNVSLSHLNPRYASSNRHTGALPLHCRLTMPESAPKPARHHHTGPAFDPDTTASRGMRIGIIRPPRSGLRTLNSGRASRGLSDWPLATTLSESQHAVSTGAPGSHSRLPP